MSSSLCQCQCCCSRLSGSTDPLSSLSTALHHIVLCSNSPNPPPFLPSSGPGSLEKWVMPLQPHRHPSLVSSASACACASSSSSSSFDYRSPPLMDSVPEHEVLPGIYVTDFRSFSSSSSSSWSSSSVSSSAEYKQPPPFSFSSSTHDEKTTSQLSPSPSSHPPSSLPLSSSSSSSSSSPGARFSGEVSGVSQLSYDLAEVQNSVDHLIASNAEMVQAMEEDGDDDGTYATAIRENMQLIDRKQRQAEEMQRVIEDALAGRAVHQAHTTSPTPAEGEGSDSGLLL